MQLQERKMELTDDEMFWDRLLDMPDVEAIQELHDRRAKLVERRIEINAYWAGRFVKRTEEDVETTNMIDATITKINQEMKERNRRLNNATWRNAVRAVCGEDAYLKCREWIVINETGVTPDKPK